VIGKAEAARRELVRIKGEQSGQGRVILAVDPGTAATGICLLRDGAPQWIQVVRVLGDGAEARLPVMCSNVARIVHNGLADGADTLAIEWQAIRPTDKRPNDILNLGIVIGAALAPERPSWCRLLTPLPVQWKGSNKADFFTKHMKARYPAAADQMHGVPEYLQHNGYDALGLAVWAINQALPWRV